MTFLVPPFWAWLVCGRVPGDALGFCCSLSGSLDCDTTCDQSASPRPLPRGPSWGKQHVTLISSGLSTADTRRPGFRRPLRTPDGNRLADFDHAVQCLCQRLFLDDRNAVFRRSCGCGPPTGPSPCQYDRGFHLRWVVLIATAISVGQDDDAGSSPALTARLPARCPRGFGIGSSCASSRPAPLFRHLGPARTSKLKSVVEHAGTNSPRPVERARPASRRAGGKPQDVR